MRYGTRMRGYITAPVTGNYTFWIASDDNSELWLSSLNDNPANKVRIGWVSGWTDSRQWDKFSTQKSAAVPLITRSALLCGDVAKGRRRWRQPCGGLGQSRANRPSRRAKSFQVRCSRHSMGPNPHSLGDPLARNLATIVTFSFVRIEEWTSFATSIRASPKGLYKDFG